MDPGTCGSRSHIALCLRGGGARNGAFSIRQLNTRACHGDMGHLLPTKIVPLTAASRLYACGVTALSLVLLGD